MDNFYETSVQVHSLYVEYKLFRNGKEVICGRIMAGKYQAALLKETITMLEELCEELGRAQAFDHALFSNPPHIN